MPPNCTIEDIADIRSFVIGELNRQATYRPMRPATGMPENEKWLDIEIIPEYKQVVNLIRAGHAVVFVSGKAGTGKSTLIRYIRSAFETNIVVLAPTGIAALNAGGATIHSYFRFPPRLITNDDIHQLKDHRLYSKLDLLIIDEISMVRADIMDAIDRFLRLNGKHKNRPFGGTQLLLVGDLFQLPPVVKRSEEYLLFARQYTSPFFFSAKSLASSRMAFVELNRIFRQGDNEFASMLNQIRIAEPSQHVLNTINSRCRPENSNPLMTLVCDNATADQINTAKLNAIPGRTYIYPGEISGKFPIEKDRLPAPANLSLKQGAQVVFTRNDESRRWVNGTIGRIRELTPNSIKAELITDYPGAVYDIERVTWTSYNYKFDAKNGEIIATPTGQYTQYPMMPAWAVTIHKSQGKTLSNLQIDLGRGAFASGQVYVALSRCRKLDDLTLSRPVEPREIKCDPRIKRFYDALSLPAPR